MRISDWEVRPGRALMVRTCAADLRAWNGFVWPRQGPVRAPDWDPRPVVGGGLHGLLWGQGNGELLDLRDDALWMAVEIAIDDVVDLIGKVKVPEGDVVLCGSRDEVTSFVQQHAPEGIYPVFGHSFTGAMSTAISGWHGSSSAGWRGTATSGWRGRSRAGELGTATAGDLGEAWAGNGGIATSGWRGRSEAGHRGVAVAGDEGQAFAGDHGTAQAGVRGSASAGAYGLAIVSKDGRAQAGEGGTLVIGRAAGLVGLAGILADTYYCQDLNGNLRVAE